MGGGLDSALRLRLTTLSDRTQSHTDRTLWRVVLLRNTFGDDTIKNPTWNVALQYQPSRAPGVVSLTYRHLARGFSSSACRYNMLPLKATYCSYFPLVFSCLTFQSSSLRNYQLDSTIVDSDSTLRVIFTERPQ
jgi:hypothetical protein